MFYLVIWPVSVTDVAHSVIGWSGHMRRLTLFSFRITLSCSTSIYQPSLHTLSDSDGNRLLLLAVNLI